MRVSNEEKQKSRARILQAASRRFREHGIAGTGLADIMKDAGMTHGGFYKHFPDKEALVCEALSEAFASVFGPVEKSSVTSGAEAFRQLYLSSEHRDAPEIGCPIAALGSEIARAYNSARQVMTEGVEARIELLRGTPAAGRTRAMAIRELVSLVGAVVVARAVNGPLSDEVLASLREEPDHGLSSV